MTKEKLRYGPLRVGIGGPVGAGKTSVSEALCRVLGNEMNLSEIMQLGPIIDKLDRESLDVDDFFNFML